MLQILLILKKLNLRSFRQSPYERELYQMEAILLDSEYTQIEHLLYNNA